MKRIGILVLLILMVLMATTSMAFGALVLDHSFPEDGGSDYQAINFAVKLYFNQDVSVEGNMDAITFTDSENNKVDFTIAYSQKEVGLALVAAQGDLKENTEYQLVVDETFQSASGELLEEPIRLHFSTRDTSKDMTVNMVLMGVMMVAVLFLSTKAMKSKEEKGAKGKKEEDKVNPYKVAKEKGKSVEEVVAKDRKAKEKAAMAEAKAKAQKEKEMARILEEKAAKEKAYESGNRKRVKGPRPVRAGGSTYKSGTKARAEAEARKEEQRKKTGTTNPKKGKTKANKKK
ncbi:MAG TPA: Ig-like domain-containing protein [Bacillota bacterium]|nr:Ig-like domain-containing protein [Bacillota bacterium]